MAKAKAVKKTRKKKDLIKITFEPHNLPFKLGIKEKAEAAEELATALQSAESLALERKSVLSDFNSRAGGLTKKIHTLTLNVKDGMQMRSLECDLHLNYTKLTATIIRTDTNETVEERPMSEEEKQMQLDLE